MSGPNARREFERRPSGACAEPAPPVSVATLSAAFAAAELATVGIDQIDAALTEAALIALSAARSRNSKRRRALIVHFEAICRNIDRLAIDIETHMTAEFARIGAHSPKARGSSPEDTLTPLPELSLDCAPDALGLDLIRLALADGCPAKLVREALEEARNKLTAAADSLRLYAIPIADQLAALGPDAEDTVDRTAAETDARMSALKRSFANRLKLRLFGPSAA